MKVPHKNKQTTKTNKQKKELDCQCILDAAGTKYLNFKINTEMMQIDILINT